MGVGSQRRELGDATAAMEWQKIRKVAPKAKLLANIGIAQLIQTPLDAVRKLTESTEALGIFVHVNPLQEVLQPEGTTDFRNGLKAIADLVKFAGVPVIVKEVGCGFSVETLKRLQDTGIFAVDVAGKGGTHWGRIEGYRSEEGQMLYQVAQTFQNWGLSTVQSLRNAKDARVGYEIWASGGVRSGLDVAKLCALGASRVGLAQPFLAAALKGDSALEELLNKLELELKITMFCTGSKKISDLQTKRVVL
jgi:isopentenyl-diphosphate delta-isomerase